MGRGRNRLGRRRREEGRGDEDRRRAANMPYEYELGPSPSQQRRTRFGYSSGTAIAGSLPSSIPWSIHLTLIDIARFLLTSCASPPHSLSPCDGSCITIHASSRDIPFGPIRIHPETPTSFERCFCKEKVVHHRSNLIKTMPPPTSINYTTLGLKQFEVFHHQVGESTRAEDILRNVYSNEMNDAEFWLLKEPIHFDQVGSKDWLLKPFTNLATYATRLFRAEVLFDVWTKRDKRHLHAVLRKRVVNNYVDYDY